MKKIFTLFFAILCLGGSIVKAETVTAFILDGDGNTYGQNQTAELTVDANGVYTISNFLNSGATLSFTFPQGTKSDMTFTGSTIKDYEWDGYMYTYLNADCTITLTDGTSMSFSMPYLYEDASYVETLENEASKYYGVICVGGYYGDGENDYAEFYVTFYFNSETSGIADVAVDENAPIEYYNLQGLRVDNPTNGLYIRRQGNNTTKVFVK